MAFNQRKAGAILSYVSLAVNAVVSFAYVPILLGALTTAEYGVYELIGSLIAYLSVMDMGLSTTLNRFYVKTKVDDEEEETENLLAIAAVVYGILTALAVAMGFGMDALVGPVFGASFTAAELELAHQMMMLVIINCVIVLPGNWFLALINANERFVFARVLAIVKYLLQVSVVLLVLSWHAGAMGVLSVQVALNFVAVICYAVYCKASLRIRARLHHWDWKLVGSLFAFSFFILLNMINNQVLWKTGQVVLGAVSGASAVAVYGVVCKLVTSGYMQVSTGIAGVFLPKVTVITAQTDDMAEINELFCRIGHIQAILVWGLCGAFAVLGEPFVRLWAGEGFAEAYPATLILMLSLSIPLVQNLVLTIMQAKGKVGVNAVVYFILAIAAFGASVPAARMWGVLGCAGATAVLIFIVTGPVMNVYYKRALGIDVVESFRVVLPVLLPVALTSFGAYGLSAIVPFGSNWATFLLGVAVFLVAYGVLLVVPTRFGFNDYERGLFRSLLGRARCTRSRPQD